MSKKQIDKPSKDIYLYRIVGLGLAALGYVSVDYESNTIFDFTMFGLFGIVWPHVAYINAKAASDGGRAERINLRLDCLFSGALIYLVELKVD